MKAFMQKLGAGLTTLRVWTVNIFTLIVLVYLLVVIGAVIRQQPEKVDPEGKVLILNPEGRILDQEVYPSKLSFPYDLPDDDQIQSRDLVRLIRAAADDDRLAGVLIDFSKVSFPGPSTALMIAEELGALSRSGKPVIAYSESLTTSSYMMAAQADEIYVHPSGAVNISGIGGYRSYTRELTDKLKVKMHNYSQGDYKSYVEGFTRSDMSEADRLQRQELYAPIWDSFKASMAEARGVEVEVFQSLADETPGNIMADAAYDNLAFAQEQDLIDGTLGFPELRAYMIDRFGKDEDAERDTYPHIVGGAYLAQLEPEKSDAEDAVAVVFVEGAIQSGEIGPGVAGSDDVAGLLRQAHENENTRALVMRVNSPGGMILASDIIRDELIAARNKDIPVYVSMGDVAASGGVWVSTPADKIYAEPTTITGSIGVAIVVPTFEDLFDYVGVNFDGVTTSELAGWGPNQPINEKLDAIFARFASSAYQRFIDSVAADRGRDSEYIRSIAGGRVWIASRAQELGLVDEIGGMEATIEAAADAAGLEDYRVNYVVKQPTLGFILLQRFARELGLEITTPYRGLADRIDQLLVMLEGVQEPRATVLCAICVVDVY